MIGVGVRRFTSLLGSAGLIAGLLTAAVAVQATPAGAVTVWSPSAACGTVDSTTVPADVLSMTVTVAGGRGGNAGSQSSGSSGSGASGAQNSATIAVTPGQTISAVVGCTGSNGADSSGSSLPGAAGWSAGGGAGHGENTVFTDGAQGGAGGGSSAVCLGAGCSGGSPGSALVVSGGGGGGGVSNCAGTPGGNGGTGGAGGSTSDAGGSGPSGTAGGGGGNSGSSSGGGSGGAAGVNSNAGQSPNGTSGTNSSGGVFVNVAGGGGGAGYKGGGAGGNSATGCKGAGGGGGGSSWVLDSATAVSQSTNPSAAGSVMVTFADPVCGPDETAADEAQFRAALACLSTNPLGPHTLDLTDDITIDDGTDPAYTGSVPLTIDGNGHTLDATTSSRALTSTATSTTLQNLTVQNGQSAAEGGGVHATGTVTATNVVFTDNSATNSGGAISASDAVDVTNATFSANAAPVGAQISATSIDLANVTLTRSTGNLLQAAGPVTLTHVTTEGESAPGAPHVQTTGGGNLTSTASVFTDELGTGDTCDIAGSVSSSYNWVDDLSCGFTGTGDTQDLLGEALLGQQRYNGPGAAELGSGPILPTMYPLSGSPLIDAIPSADCSADTAVDLDQRGVDRPFADDCDIGAIEAVFPVHPMSDVTPFYEATVRWITSDVNDPQILLGFDDDTFRQTVDISRGQVVRMYYRASGAPDVSGLPAHGFSDVTPFYEDAVRWAKASGVFDGFPDNTFRESSPISRGNFTRSLYGVVGKPGIGLLSPHGFTDVIPFYDDAVTWAKANGLANGFVDNTFRHSNNIKRGAGSRIFYNAAQTPAAWADTMVAPDNMLFRSNL